MNEHDIAETAYKNGYETGKRDAAEGADVVRCGACKSCREFSNGTKHCINPRGLVGDLTDKFYCSFGERREDGNESEKGESRTMVSQAPVCL